jgi:RHS repeat-associated protein
MIMRPVAFQRAFQSFTPICFLTVRLMSGQTMTTNVTDGTTPPSVAAGAPVGAYALSGFETINLYNGNLDFQLPLLKIGGRGTAQYTIVLPIQSRWHVDHTVTPTSETFLPRGSSLPIVPYSPGNVFGRQTWDTSAGTYTQPSTGITYLEGATLTRLTWVSQDGTEHELRDILHAGQPIDPPPGGYGTSSGSLTPPSRGKVFAAADGAAATFISDTEITDSITFNGQSRGTRFDASGWLFLANGTRCRVTQGVIVSLQDRNGNYLSFSYPNGSLGGFTAIDALGRTITVVTADFRTTFSDTITFSAFQGAAGGRTITINYNLLSSTPPSGPVLASGQSIQTFNQLFPDLNGSSTTTFDPYVVSSVQLPDGSSYRMQYTSYGELARIVLPTGGAFEYAYPLVSMCAIPNSGIFCFSPDGISSPYQIARRVIERRVKPDGVALEGSAVFTAAYYSQDPLNFYTSRGSTVVTVDHKDGSGGLLATEKHYYFGDLSSPSSYLPTPAIFYPKWTDGREYRTEQYSGATALRTTQNTWGQLACSNCWFSDPQSDTAPPYSSNVCQAVTTLDSVTSGEFMSYDQYSNRTDLYEYDYGFAPAVTQACPTNAPSGFKRHTATTFLSNGYDQYNTANPPASIHIRDLPTQQSVLDSSGTVQAMTQNFYDEAGFSIQDCAGIVNHDPTYGTSYTTRGNRTTVRNFTTATASIDTHQQFDIAGNVVSSTDGRGFATTIAYGSAFACGLPTSITKVVNGAPQITTTNYDFSTGKAITVTDPNSAVTQFDYAGDALDRLKTITRADSGKTTYTYDPAHLHVISTTDISTSPTAPKNVIKEINDGLGRPIESRQYEDGDASGTNYIATQRVYDAMGRLLKSSNPFRPSEQPAWTTTNYDALGRVVQTTMPDNAISTIGYVGNVTTFRDPADNWRQNTTDALGRLTQVIEDPTANISIVIPPASAPTNFSHTSSFSPSLITTYTYDLLDDLKTVSQAGQTRTFNYDFLKRLRSAINPESGTTSYPQYDGNGNLMQKADGSGNTISYTYDVLNRVTLKTYSGTLTAPPVTYCYDGQTFAGTDGQCTGSPVTNFIGRLTQVYSTVSSTKYTGYDSMGRVTGSVQTTDGQPYVFGYAYNLAGGMTSMSFPSTRVVTFGFDPATRINAVTSAARNYATSVGYASHGGISSIALGNGLFETTSFNVRLQPFDIRLGASAGSNSLWELQNGFGTSNNGNVLQQTITAAGMLGSIVQVYRYDPLNRLQLASENPSSPGAPVCPDTNSQWCEQFSYDARGNRLIAARTNVGVSPLEPTAFDANNRISGTGWTYDGAGRGNITANPIAQTFVYDAENRQTSATSGSSTTQYVYDGDGRRVKRIDPGGTKTIFVYDAAGNLAGEYSTASNSAAVQFLTTDHLGSTRVITDASGLVKERLDYRPFGDDILVTQGSPRSGATGYGIDVGVKQKFTSKERDSETGLDFFGARYFASAQGRFTSPDPVIITPERLRDPQQLNRYAYVRNNPLRLVDPTGEDLNCTGNANSQDQCFAFLQDIAGDAADRLSINESGQVRFDASGLDLRGNEGANVINDLVNVSNNLYGLTIGAIAETQRGPQAVELASNLPPAFDQFGLVKGHRGTPMLSQLPVAPLTDQITINPNAATRFDELGRPVATVSYVFHELAEAYAKIDLSQPYGSTLRVVNGAVQVGFLDPGAHDQARNRENTWRQQRPNLQGTGRAADQLIVDPQSHPRPNK